MNERTLIVDSEQADWLLDQIEHRLEAIGKVYYRDGQPYSHDLEITRLRQLAVQLGVEFDIRSERDSFEITKSEIKPHNMT